jgi:RNA polymerase sigma-70 factor, ECF subfamily
MTDLEAATVHGQDHGELLRRCAQGDKVAFRELYARSAPQLFAVLLRILGRVELAEDALHDVFIRIWQNAGTYRPQKGQPMTWMMSIARYRALDLLRGARAERLVDDGDLQLAGIQTLEPGPMAAAEQSAEVRALRACLEKLTDGQQRSIRLAYLSGYTHEQIAATLTTPLGTVKSWVRRGLQSLKVCLER